MTSRWLAAAVLLVSVSGAAAQLAQDPQNAPVILPDPHAVPKDAIPPSRTNAESATESPAITIAREKQEAKQDAKQSPCDPANPCAMPTPAR